MDRLVIRGGRRLEGEVAIAGAKNAALPELCAVRNAVTVRAPAGMLIDDAGAPLSRGAALGASRDITCRNCALLR